jgi:hypothetical protein
MLWQYKSLTSCSEKDSSSSNKYSAIEGNATHYDTTSLRDAKAHMASTYNHDGSGYEQAHVEHAEEKQHRALGGCVNDGLHL